MNKVLPIISILILFQSCLEKDDIKSFMGENPQSIRIDTLFYKIDRFNSGVTLGLLSDSTFFYKVEFWGCMGGGQEKYTFGKYKQENNKIELVPEKSKVLMYWNEENPFDYSNPEINEFSYQKDTIRIKTEYYKVDIKEKSYLLSGEEKDEFFAEKTETNDFQELANHLKGNEEFYGNYFTGKKADSDAFAIEQLPEKWRNILK